MLRGIRKALVVGCSGSGKTTVARRLAAKLGAPHVELDALHHGERWAPRVTFADDVDRATQAPAWVVDGNYPAVRELLWSRAEAVVWVDPPRLVIERQVIWRSVSRWLMGVELWNGNREKGPRHWLDPEHPIRWAWKTHPEYREVYGARFADPGWQRLVRVRLRSRREVEAFFAELE